MKAAGIREFGAPVELLELPGPRTPLPDEVLIDVRASGMGHWDEIARKGGWDLGTRPPMALGVEAAGVAAAVGDQVSGIRAGSRSWSATSSLSSRVPRRWPGSGTGRPGRPWYCCPRTPDKASGRHG